MIAPHVIALLLAAGPSLRLAPSVARPGDAVLLVLKGGPAAQEPAGTAVGRPLRFYRAKDGFRALVALPLETPPGKALVEARWGADRLTADLTVVDPGFPSVSLRLASQYVEPPPSVRERIASDRAAFAEAYDKPFGPPLFDRISLPREARVTGRFGDQRVVNRTHAVVHYGLDMKGELGAPVSAAADGEVVLARSCYESGNSVVLSHGAGVFTSYFHLSRIDVVLGQAVRRGDRIGLVGATGRATGPHLHFGARVDGLLVDPESLVRIDFENGSAPPHGPREPSMTVSKKTGAPPALLAPISGQTTVAPTKGKNGPASIPLQ